LTPVLDTFAHL